MKKKRTHLSGGKKGEGPLYSTDWERKKVKAIERKCKALVPLGRCRGGIELIVHGLDFHIRGGRTIVKKGLKIALEESIRRVELGMLSSRGREEWGGGCAAIHCRQAQEEGGRVRIVVSYEKLSQERQHGRTRWRLARGKNSWGVYNPWEVGKGKKR